jgi:serine/threonine-protein kinase
VGGFEILGELGRGGMGVVFRVRTQEGKEAALKLLPMVEPGKLARFERERRLLSSLGEAEGFVGLLDAGTSAEGAWLLMPLVPGGTLGKKLLAGPLTVPETVALGGKLAEALGRAHERGIVHRDIKPENVLFTSDGRPLVADLGLAKHFDRSGPGATASLSLTQRGMTKGTAGYMAPEQIQDARSAGPQSDVFALGAVLWECLAGTPAFQGASALEVFARVSEGAKEPLERTDVPSWLEETLERALATDPRVRFPDGASLARALRGQGRGLEKLPGRVGRRRSPLLVAAVLALGLVALGAGLLLGGSLAKTSAPPSPPATNAPPPAPPAPAPKPPPEEPLPRGLSLPGRKVPAASGEVPLYLYKLPDGSEIEMVKVPAGEFFMGSDDADAEEQEKPWHKHHLLRDCWIGRTDVTWRQYLAFTKAAHHAEPDEPSWRDRTPKERSDHPVAMVSWEDAGDYCTWAGLALPREEEWEKAARGEDGRRYPWGDEWDPGTRCNFADSSYPVDELTQNGVKLLEIFAKYGIHWDREHSDGFAFTSPVGSFPGGVSPVGALDMAGDVGQWCADFYEEHAYERYARGDTSPPATSDHRSARGGGFDDDARHNRSSARNGLLPVYRNGALGFRVCLRSR